MGTADWTLMRPGDKPEREWYVLPHRPELGFRGCFHNVIACQELRGKRNEICRLS